MKYPCLYLIVSSFLIAAVGFWIGPASFLLFAGPGDVPSRVVISYCTLTAWIWALLAVTAILVYRWRAAVILLTAPFVLLWPFLWIDRLPGCSVFGCW